MYLSELGHIFCASGRRITDFPRLMQEKSCSATMTQKRPSTIWPLPGLGTRSKSGATGRFGGANPQRGCAVQLDVLRLTEVKQLRKPTIAKVDFIIATSCIESR
jgi:hypothetical protein